jgi:hypothetical protein
VGSANRLWSRVLEAVNPVLRKDIDGLYINGSTLRRSEASGASRSRLADRGESRPDPKSVDVIAICSHTAPRNAVDQIAKLASWFDRAGGAAAGLAVVSLAPCVSSAP